MFTHGGLFRTAGVAQKFLAGALATPVSIAESASEGRALRIAVLASCLSATASGSELDLNNYLSANESSATQCLKPPTRMLPTLLDFAAHLVNYREGLAAQRSAIDVL
jgi:hypothetical protein